MSLRFVVGIGGVGSRHRMLAAGADEAPAARGRRPSPRRNRRRWSPRNCAEPIDTPFTGDLDQLASRRIIRAGVPFNRTFYFVDKGTQRGLSYEYLMIFEEALNKKLKTRNLKVHVVLLPLSADALIPALRAGKIDMVVAQLTITPARQELVGFTVPTRKNVDEVVVTGPGAPPLSVAGGSFGARSLRSTVVQLLREPGSVERQAGAQGSRRRCPAGGRESSKTMTCWRW